MKSDSEKKSIILFLALAFCLPLISVVLIKSFTIFQSGFLYFVLYGFQAAAPTLSALITVTALHGMRQTGQFLKKCFVSNIKIRYIILSVIFPLMIFALTEASCVLFLNFSVLSAKIGSWRFVIVLWSLLAEETGWRGFLQEKLDGYLGKYLTPLALGLIWSSWHYHFFLLGTLSAPIFLFTIGCVAESYGYYWLTKKSMGNIMPASVWHFTGNLCFGIFTLYPEANGGSVLPYLLFVVFSVVTAIGITLWGVLSSVPDAKTNA